MHHVSLLSFMDYDSWLSKLFLVSRAVYFSNIQNHMHPSCWNYHYIEYARKAYNHAGPTRVEEYYKYLQSMNAMKDYFTESINEINHLKQLDQTPNLELRESKWELYKISFSFSYAGVYNL